jgi:hypothetical protein
VAIAAFKAVTLLREALLNASAFNTPPVVRLFAKLLVIVPH